jgi:DNA-binding LacI/PurR family transcriptional regulator
MGKFMKFDLEKNHHQPLFEQLADALRKEILEGRLEAGVALPSLQEMTQLAGVSLFTVDRAINSLIKEGLLIRRPKKGTYVSKTFTAPQSESGRKKVIFAASGAHQIESSPKTYHGLIYMGILDAAVKAGVHVVTSSLTNLASDIRLYDQQQAFDVRGGIFVDDWHQDDVTKIGEACPHKTFIATNARTPDFELTPANVHGVFNDDFGGGYALGAALAESGIHRVWILTRHLPVENYRLRVQGMRQAFGDAGRTVPDSQVIESDNVGEINERVAYSLMKKLPVESLLPTDAIMCVSDQLAIGVLRFLDEQGVGEKKRPLVTGYDGWMPISQESLTFPSVRVDFGRLGRMSLDLLLRDDSRKLPKIMAVTPQYLPRGSRMQQAGEARELTLA